MVPSRLLFLSPILLLIIITSTTDQAAALAQPQPAADHLLSHFCSNHKGNYTTTGAYRTNLNHLLSSLPFKGSGHGFYSSSYGRNTTSGAIYAIGLCKGDIGTTRHCLHCLNTSRSALMELCANQKEAIVWYDNCMLRYSNRSLHGVMDTLPAFNLWSTQSVPSSEFDVFFRQLRWLLEALRNKAAKGGSLKFAKNNATILNYRNGLSSLTALVHCSPDLSELQCGTCLLGAFGELPKCCDGKEGGRVLRPSCNFNYQLNQVIKVNEPKGSVIPNLGRRARDGRVGILILFATVVSLVLMISIGIYAKVVKTRRQPINFLEKMDEHMAMESLLFDCGAIRVATNNFSEANKLGGDGYGTVYRGSLSNAKSIAVRRLSINYVKEYTEIMKEVLLMAKLQHPNLIELLGCASEENSERLLVYELFPNATLDRIIFGI
ncbi:cysteine-rich repeat secretory protein 38-like [Rosa chinensis]|uniref:cysteine-rich repeat secretory protein 38-like n=1 Tax=Rosa chinensis TaxID=74649 RepID=UPI000D08CAE3|nr:cysteine-rich repeat secretory protein 38-like [Rosa chinensis]